MLWLTLFCRAAANCTWAIGFLCTFFHLLNCTLLCFSRNDLKFVEFFSILLLYKRVFQFSESGFLLTSSFLWGWRACERLAGIWKIHMQLSFLGRGLLSFPQVKKIGADTNTERSTSTGQSLSPSFPIHVGETKIPQVFVPVLWVKPSRPWPITFSEMELSYLPSPTLWAGWHF